MKPNRNKYFIVISSFCLLVVMIIQLNWIIKTAKYKEEQFDEKANIILSRTTEALCSDKQTLRRLEATPGAEDKRIIDSLLKHFMSFYNFHEDYSFEIAKTLPFSLRITPGVTDTVHRVSATDPACYIKNLDEFGNKNGWRLKLNFPKRQRVIFKEMGIPFFISFILILIVIILFWKTVSSLVKEKIISEHTTDFLNNMTHEFKTPLASIALAGKMIMKEASEKKENEIKENSEIILEENEKLRLQVEQVLSATSLENGDIPMQKTEVDIHQLIKNCLRPIGIQIESKHGTLNLKLDAQHTIIMGDQTHLINTIRNLLDNSIKYSRDEPNITLQTRNSDNEIIIIISDMGIGIDRAYQKKVFDKFFRVPKGDIHDVRGFGLGLAYVKKIIEMHDGTIRLDSERQKGTIITIALPNE